MEAKNLLENETEEKTDDRAAEIEALEARQREADIARARAEGELAATREAFKTQQAQPVVQPQISEEQWQRAETESGLTRQQIMANAQLTKQMLDSNLAPLQKSLDDARREVREAQEELKRVKTRGDASSTQRDFFKANPAYNAHEKEVNDFVEMFPESDRSDPAKLKTILEKSKTYVRGLVGAKMRSANKGNDGSARLSGGIDEGEEGDDERIDFTGLDDVGQRRVVEDIHRELNGKLTDKERNEIVKRSSTSDGKGVRFSSEDEWARGEKMLREGPKSR